ncbi:transmembrane protein 11 homolog, mitochondrial isoform X2 [Drosophila obscura]|uniref:transmembrane protein 11 homolog, mitochondrial isoform X2 n=1 Tax=Drosophila obscura TaxID=7282 RepID=UPI001BB1B907|nr:transmembrane protein 11 homolog, mitochondrial isoform X2 [Drosophila obscura]
MVSRGIESASKVPTFHVIREVYDSSNAHERFEAELEKALEAKVAGFGSAIVCINRPLPPELCRS